VLVEFRPALRRWTVLHGDALPRATLAVYNCGRDNVRHAARHGLDLDSCAREILFG
jgi:hypothetical protein